MAVVLVAAVAAAVMAAPAAVLNRTALIGGVKMPYVNIKITREGNVTPEQKRQLIEGATNLLHDVLGKNKATTVVVIDEVDTDNWGIGGIPVTEIRKQK